MSAGSFLNIQFTKKRRGLLLFDVVCQRASQLCVAIVVRNRVAQLVEINGAVSSVIGVESAEPHGERRYVARTNSDLLASVVGATSDGLVNFLHGVFPPSFDGYIIPYQRRKVNRLLCKDSVNLRAGLFLNTVFTKKGAAHSCSLSS